MKVTLQFEQLETRLVPAAKHLFDHLAVPSDHSGTHSATAVAAPAPRADSVNKSVIVKLQVGKPSAHLPLSPSKLRVRRQATLLTAASERAHHVDRVGPPRVVSRRGYLRIMYKSGMVRTFIFADDGTLRAVFEKNTCTGRKSRWTKVCDDGIMQTWEVKDFTKKATFTVQARIRVMRDRTITVTSPRGQQTMFQKDGTITTFFVGTLDELLEIRPGVSERFVTAVECELARLPLDRREFLASYGFKFVLTPLMEQGGSGFASIIPRGYPTGSSINQARGLAQPWHDHVYVSEYYMSNGVRLPTLPTLSEVLWHELGHELFDYVDLTAAEAAYNADVATLTDSQRQWYSYFLQPNRAGLDEAFAQSIAAMNRGIGTERFEQDWSNLASYVQSSFGAYRITKPVCPCTC